MTIVTGQSSARDRGALVGSDHRGGFTLVELLAAMTVLIVLLLIMVTLTSQTNTVWRRSRARIDSFQGARNAYQRITTTLRQATLNTYLDYYNSSGVSRAAYLAVSTNSPANFVPSSYGRASELQFICGQAATLLPTTPPTLNRPTHAIFFNSPLGHVSNPTSATNDFKNLNQVLNAVGYYIQFSDDSTLRPGFLKSLPVSSRFRLMELNQPSQSLGLYFSTVSYTSPGSWYSLAVDTAPAPVIVMADNIVALILRPEVASAAAGAASTVEIAPNYAYDTKAYQSSSNSVNTLSKNQLPPLVQVTLVAIDAESAKRLATTYGSAVPPLYVSAPFTDVTKYDQDLSALLATLDSSHLVYQVFVSDVSIPGAVWSTSN